MGSNVQNNGDVTNERTGVLTLDLGFLLDVLRDEVDERLNELARAIETPRPLLYTRRQTAEILSIGVTTVDHLRRAGRLQVTYVGSAARFHIDDIAAVADALRGGEPFDLKIEANEGQAP